MISKTIGFFGVHNIFRQTHMTLRFGGCSLAAGGLKQFISSSKPDNTGVGLDNQAELPHEGSLMMFLHVFFKRCPTFLVYESMAAGGGNTPSLHLTNNSDDIYNSHQ